MTNDNNTRKKANAVFFAAIMVVSMFAAGFAAAPAAVAAQTVTLSDDIVQSGTDIDADVTNETGDEEIFVVIDEDGDGQYDSGESNGSVPTTSGTDTVTGLSTDGLDEGDYTVYALNKSSGSSLSDGEDITGEASTTLTIDNTAPDPRKATHYVNGTTTPVLEVAFPEDVSATANAEAEIGLSDGTVVGPVDIESANVTGGQILLNTSTVYSNVQNVSVTGVEDAYGNEVSDEDFAVTYAPVTVDATDNSATFESFSGENVAIENASFESSFDIEGPGISRTRGTGANSVVYVLDTDDFETGDYNITNEAGDETVLEVDDLGLDVEADADNFTTNDAVTATVTADTIDRDVTAELLDSDGDVVAEDTANIDSDGQAAIDFGTQSTGTYSIEVTDDSSGISATSGDFNINEAPEGDVSFEEGFVTEERGDTANITINFQGDIETAYLRVGDDDEVGYESNITVDSGGEDSVTVAFNTYVAGNTTDLPDEDLAYVADADSDAEVTASNESIDDLANMLATGTYPLALSSESVAAINNDNIEAVGDLELEERSVEGFQLWTTSADVFEDVEDVDDILSGADNGVVQQTDSLTEGDVLVHQVSATGFEGAIQTLGSFETVVDNDAVAVTIEQTSDTTAPNRDPKQVDLQQMIDDDEVTFISTEGEYFIAFNEENIETVGSRDVSFDDGFDVTVEVRDERLLSPDRQELEDNDDGLEAFYESASASFVVEEATGEFDTPVEV